MLKKIQDTLCICICIYLGLLIFAKVSARIEPEHLVGRSVRQFARHSVQNVFDEMVMNEAQLLIKSANKGEEYA